MNNTIKKDGWENMTMRALYLLAILFVVDGHISSMHNLFDLNGLFSYYSFHLLLFAFGSGYFFKDAACQRPLRALAHSARRLLVPLYGWNIAYGLLAAFLRRFGGFTQGQPISAYTLLLAPLVDGEHFHWNLGSWFVFPLFLAQAVYLLVRKISAIWRGNEWATFAVCLVPGAVCAELCHAGKNAVLPLFLMRALILLPGYAAGALYRRKLEKLDRLPTVPYLLGIMLLRLLLAGRYENLAYLLSSCTFFECGAFGVYAGAALAIAFWLRVARLLAPHMARSRLALYASRHTFDIMMHHYMGFFAVDAAFLIANALRIGAARFSVLSFRTQEFYLYAPGERQMYAVLYLAAGMLLPLIVAWGMEFLKKRIFRKE